MGKNKAGDMARRSGLRAVGMPAVSTNAVRGIPLSSAMSFRAPVAIGVTVLYLTFWNVDLTMVLGGFGGEITANGRWVIIACVFLVPLFDIIMGRHPGSLFLISAMMLVLVPPVLLSTNQFYSIVEWVRILSLLFLFLIFQNRPGVFRHIYKAVGCFVIVVTILSLPHLDAPSNVPIFKTAGEGLGRLRDAGITTHPNNFGFIANLVIIYILSQFLQSRPISPIMKLLGLTILMIAIYALISSDSRTAKIVMTITFGIYIWLRLWRGSFRSFGNHISLVRMIIFFGMLGVISVPLMMIISGIDLSGFVGTDSFGASNAARISLWQNALASFTDHPIAGQGLGVLVQEGYSSLNQTFNYAPYAHNALLNILYVAGICGFLWFMILLNAIAAITLSAVISRQSLGNNTTTDKELFFFAMVVTATLVGAVIEGGLQNNYGLNSFIAIALGALASESRRVKSLSRRAPRQYPGKAY